MTFFETLADAFKLRLLNHRTEDEEEAWEQYTVNLINKKLAARHPKGLRPISISAMLMEAICSLSYAFSGANLRFIMSVAVRL